jgi:hypothetical protein
MTFDRGDIIQLRGHSDYAVVVDIKWNGAEIWVHWIRRHTPQAFGISYIKGMITSHNYRMIREP